MWRTASILVGVVLVLVTLGIIMLASTSGVPGDLLYKDSTFFLKRQAAALVVGCIAFFVTSRLNYRVWQTWAIAIGIVTIVLLVMVITPGVGISVKGSRRWLSMGFTNLQPSELAKFASIILLAWWMSRVQRTADGFQRGLMTPLLLLGTLTGLVFIEPDFGTTMLMGVVGFAIMFVGGSRVSYLVIAGALGFTAISLAIMQDEERMRRIIAFLNPEKYAQDEAFQLLNAIYAFVMGGGTGVGLGGSMQKQFYLPEAHTDFIFAILGEELGLGASLAVVVLFFVFFLCGLYISMNATDRFGRLTAFGITSMITLQAAINIGVVTGCLPTKGLPLPFISYGGTSLAISLMMVGILVSIAIQSGGKSGAGDIPVIKDRGHSF